MEDSTAAIDGVEEADNAAIGNYNRTKLVAGDPFKLESDHKDELIERIWTVENQPLTKIKSWAQAYRGAAADTF
jgi:hypothetical protein